MVACVTQYHVFPAVRSAVSAVSTCQFSPEPIQSPGEKKWENYSHNSCSEAAFNDI